MPYCPKCKVSLAEGAAFCPLCLGPSAETLMEPESTNGTESFRPSTRTKSAEPMPMPGEVRDADVEERLSGPERRKLVMELLTVSFSLVLVITVSIDMIFFSGFSWSRYVALILIVAWLFSYMPLVFWGHPWLLFSVLGPSLPLALFCWALFSGSSAWFLPVGLPIVLSLEAVTVSVLVILHLLRQRGLNYPAVILAGLAFLCVALDVTVFHAVSGLWGLTWSLVVVFSVLPVSGLFFYLHYRLLKRASLRKLFRL